MINVFHMIKTAAVLLHPIAPEGTKMVQDYMQLDDSMWNWDYIFDPMCKNILEGQDNHDIKFLEPRVDFFKRHESQFDTK